MKTSSLLQPETARFEAQFYDERNPGNILTADFTVTKRGSLMACVERSDGRPFFVSLRTNFMGSYITEEWPEHHRFWITAIRESDR